MPSSACGINGFSRVSIFFERTSEYSCCFLNNFFFSCGSFFS